MCTRWYVDGWYCTWDSGYLEYTLVGLEYWCSYMWRKSELMLWKWGKLESGGGGFGVVEYIDDYTGVGDVFFSG
jgi:hypothetical protein